MSWFDDHEDEIVFGPRDDDGRAPFRRDGDGVICRDCAKAGLRWRQDEQGWWLEDADGYQHECDPEDRDFVTRGMFDDLGAA